MRYAIATDYEYGQTHKRDRLTIWSGGFASTYEGQAYSLPGGDGYMVDLEYKGKVRVACAVGRTDDNYLDVDKAINDAINEAFPDKPTPVDITADDVRVGDTIIDKGHALPFTVAERDDRRGYVWLRADIAGRPQWTRMAPSHPVRRIGAPS